jgi:Tol biopolymer transport system component
VPTPVLPLASGDLSYRWPAFLSDGRRFVYYNRAPDHYGLYLASVDGGAPALLLDHAPFNAIVTAPGYLLTMRERTLLAYPFDERRGRLTGEPVQVAEQVGGSSAAFASFSVSANGTLAYSTGLTMPSRLEWFDRAGGPVGVAAPDGDYPGFAISPDQKRVAVTRIDPRTTTSDLWILELSRNNLETIFTTDPGTERAPVWSPDSTRVAYGSDKRGGNFLFVQPVGQAEPDRPVSNLDVPFPTDWSPDGRYIAFHSPAAGGSYDVMVTDLQDPSKAMSIGSPGINIGGRFSPDGHWLAYASDLSGRMEIYVRPFNARTSPQSVAPVQLSTNGGTEPHWRKDGREIYYLAPDRKMMVVSVRPGTSVVTDPPRALFQTRAPALGSLYRTNYDVTADGSRFLITTPVEGARTEASITVIINWLSDIRKK